MCITELKEVNMFGSSQSKFANVKIVQINKSRNNSNTKWKQVYDFKLCLYKRLKTVSVLGLATVPT